MNIADIDFSDYEPVPDPVPANVSPREFVLWATGKDYEELKDFVTGRDFTWEELKRMGTDEIVMQLIQLSPVRPIKFRKKS